MTREEATRLLSGLMFKGELKEALEMAIKALEQEPQQETGRWIYDFMTADGHRMYRCSKCGWFLRQKHSETLNRLKWCCSCGAKMQEVEE